MSQNEFNHMERDQRSEHHLESLERHPEEAALAKLAFEYNGKRLFRAADPGYPRNFTRDSLIAAHLMRDYEAMRDQVAYTAHFQGIKTDPFTGEEPGKAHHEKHHEMPDAIYNGRSTAYNACDTTALFLESIAELARNGQESIIFELESNIDSAIGYIKSHIADDLFWEDPRLSGADRFGLKVTYWKDSVLNNPDRMEPTYPIVFTQAHFQNAEALMSISALRGDNQLQDLAHKMYEAGLKKLWAGGHFVTAIDQYGVIDPPSSDSLMSLLHVPPNILPEGYAAEVEEYMKNEQLETGAGYLSGHKIGRGVDEYHTRYIWTHEQSLLHMAAKKYGLLHAASVCERLADHISDMADQGIFPELIERTSLHGGQIDYVPEGNHVQLWAVATYEYFRNYQDQQSNFAFVV